MKKIKFFAIITTAVCGLYFTSSAQTTTTDKDKDKDKDKYHKEYHKESKIKSSDDLSLSSSPTFEETSQGYKIQVWVLSESEGSDMMYLDDKERNEARMNRSGNIESDTRDNTRSSDFKIDEDRNRDANLNRDANINRDATIGTDRTGTTGTIGGTEGVGTTGSDDFRTPSTTGTIGTGTGTGTIGSGTTGTSGTASGTIGTGTSGSQTGVSGTVGTGTTGTTGNQSGTFGSGTNQQGTATGTRSGSGVASGSSSTWDRSSGQATAMRGEKDKSTVVVKVIEESTGREITPEEIEMKVTTPSKKSFTADLREKDEFHTAELAFTEEGTYNIQATITTEDNRNIVVPMTYDHTMDNISDSERDIDRNMEDR